MRQEPPRNSLAIMPAPRDSTSNLTAHASHYIFHPNLLAFLQITGTSQVQQFLSFNYNGFIRPYALPSEFHLNKHISKTNSGIGEDVLLSALLSVGLFASFNPFAITGVYW